VVSWDHKSQLPNCISIDSAIFAYTVAKTPSHNVFLRGGQLPKIAPSRWRNWSLIQYIVPWHHPSQHLKRHLDRFSRFCFAGILKVTNIHTHKHTNTHRERPRYSICSNSPHIMQCMWCDVAWQKMSVHVRSIRCCNLCHLLLSRSSSVSLIKWPNRYTISINQLNKPRLLLAFIILLHNFPMHFDTWRKTSTRWLHSF